MHGTSRNCTELLRVDGTSRNFKNFHGTLLGTLNGTLTELYGTSPEHHGALNERNLERNLERNFTELQGRGGSLGYSGARGKVAVSLTYRC